MEEHACRLISSSLHPVLVDALFELFCLDQQRSERSDRAALALSLRMWMRESEWTLGECVDSLPDAITFSLANPKEK
jgi:hypothetical protein